MDTRQPSAIVCLTGSELTRGETHDRNGPFLATELAVLGVEVRELRLVPDQPEEMERIFRDSIEHADVVLVSGGLGPTADDQTVGVLAKLLGRGVRRDDEAVRRMRSRALKRYGEDGIPENYYKQAEVVEGSRVLLNPVGLAPGCLVETRRGFVVLMPGVPREMQAMFRELVAPEIQGRFDLARPRIFRAKILGHGESWAEARIRKLDIDFSTVQYGISARPGELLVKWVIHEPRNQPYLDHVKRRLEEEFGEDLWVLPEGLKNEAGEPVEVEHAKLIHELLLSSGKTVATAESCTGGLIAKRLTDHAGSSTYFLGTLVAYGNRVKANVLGVDARVLEERGAVSAEVCREMALAAKRLFGADYGIGVTGIAGPGGGSEDKPVGLVYIGLALPRGKLLPDVVVERQLFWGNRRNVRALSAVRALDLIRRDLERNSVR